MKSTLASIPDLIVVTFIISTLISIVYYFHPSFFSQSVYEELPIYIIMGYSVIGLFFLIVAYGYFEPTLKEKKRKKERNRRVKQYFFDAEVTKYFYWKERAHNYGDVSPSDKRYGWFPEDYDKDFIKNYGQDMFDEMEEAYQKKIKRMEETERRKNNPYFDY